MTICAALLSSFCLAVSITYAVQLTCDRTVHCPCGSTNRNVTLCIQSLESDPCPRLSNCRSCEDGLSVCLDCPEGFGGSFCTRKVTQAKSRQKRQFYYPVRRPHRPHNQNQRMSAAQVSSHCPSLESPKLGSIRCFSSNQLRTCVGRCLPGYSFRDYIAQEITVECRGGVWTPFTEFPDCESGGHCDLVVQGHGSFNCTTGMDGTRCDVKCDGRYAGRYFCYPGRHWEPHLPYCVRPKDTTTTTTTEERQNCRCEYGASCDSRGNCVCPAGRTGTFCETVVPEKVMCRDPGFISNGLRKNTDGSESTVRQTYEEGQSVVYSCTSEEYALQGSSLLTCRGDRTWSRPLPKCIKPRVAPQVFCPDPGQVANAERLNSDGSPSVGVQQYSVGQSVVYTCHPGFALQRRSLITCLASGAWSSRTPHCTRVTPPAPVTTTTTARPDVSLRFCRDPGVDPNGSRRPASPSNRRGFPQGSHLEYSCRDGYVLSGEPDLFCIVSGKWSAGRPRCEAQSRTPLEPSIRYCDSPGPISNGRVVYVPALSVRRPLADASEDEEMEERYPEGARLLYSCNRGYSFRDREEAKTVTLTCEDTGRWSGSPPRCLRELAYCPHPGSVSNGRVVYVPALSERRPRPPDIDDDALDERYPQGGRLRYSCDDGYLLEGTATLTCEESGYWSAVTPRCVEDSDTDYCDRPGPIANGRFVHVPNLNERRRPPSDDVAGDEERYPEGSRLRFSCNNGYRLRGNATLTCQASGFWSGAFPRCVPIVTSRNVMFCENPGPVLNGRVQSFVPGGIRGNEREREGEVDEYPEGSRLEYSCQEGYQVEGSDRLTCQSTGFWSPPNPPTCVGECGRSFMQTSHRVLNGLKTETGEWPWVVAIFVEQNNSSRLVCGGAVLNPNTIVTAGHCISRASSFILRFGKLHRSVRNDDTEVLVRRSTRVIVHPDFKNSTLESDIGLLMFQPRIRYSVRVQPICLPSAESTARNLMTGKVGYVAGWGITELEAPSDELLLAKLPVLTNDDCRDSYRRQNITLPITRNMFCAGHADARQSACEGDSGSPLVFYDGVAQRYTLEGLVSFGVEGQCGLQGRYTIFTKVFQFLPWIYRNLQ